MLVDGTEDDLGGVLGNLQLGIGDGSSVVQDGDDVLGLGADCGDVDGPAAVFVAALTAELVCWENSENAFF